MSNYQTTFFKAYIRGQEEDHEYDSHDFEYCGKDLPERIKTPGPRLVLLFNAGSRPGSGFKATFHFETEYLIPVGTPSPDGTCSFTYRSISRKEGSFNSPRYPSNYPSSTNCTYIFLATPREQVLYPQNSKKSTNDKSTISMPLQVQIVFDSFKVRTDNLVENASLGAWSAYRCYRNILV